MMNVRFSFGGWKTARQLSLVLALCLVSLLTTDNACHASEMSHHIYTPKALRPAEIKTYLSDLALGTASTLPGTNGVLITADAEVLAKANTILSVIDSSVDYTIRTLGSTDQARTLPSNERIAQLAGPLTIGTFAAPPQGTSSRRALIDILDGQVVAIIPTSKIDAVMRVIEGRELTTAHKPALVDHKVEDIALRSLMETRKPQVLAANAEDTPPHGRLTEGATGTMPEASLSSQSVPLGEAPKKPSYVSEYETPKTEIDEEELEVSLQDEIPLAMLLGYVGEYLDLNFVYKKEQIEGTNVKVSLMLSGDRQKGKVKGSELYPLLESVLKFTGFAMTRKGKFVHVVPVDDAMTIDPELHTDGGLIEHGNAVITRIFTLQHISPKDAENLLKEMKLGVSMVGIEETKKLIVTAFAFRMPRIETVLEMADTPGEPKGFRYRQLQYTLAESLKEKVKALVEQLGSVEVSISEPTPEIERRRGESEASYQARVRAAERARASTASRTPAKPPQDGVYLDADERTNRILMIGREKQLDIVDKLIQSLDVEKQDLTVMRLYEIENLEAIDAREKLIELGLVQGVLSQGSQRLTGDNRSTTTNTPSPRTPTPTNLTTSTTEASKEGLQDQPLVVVVEATNSLLVKATPEQHELIKQTLEYVDHKTNDLAIPYKIYPLKNQKPSELHAVIEKLIIETVQDKEGKVEQKLPKIEDDITVVADDPSFSLIVYASPKHQEWIGSLITELDRQRPQVLIDVTLVEITQNDEFTYDLNVLGSIPDLTQTSGLTTAIMGGVEGGDPLSLVQRLQASDRKRFLDLQSTSGNGTGFYGDEHINVLLKAMDTKNYGRVLAKPKILVNDGQEGTVATTDTTYVYTQEGTVNTSAATSLVQTSVDWKNYEAGITLTITPNINEGDLLRLEVNMERSDFGAIQEVVIGNNEYKSPPELVTSNVTTTVTVPDESTIILGGMAKLNQKKGGNKVPILGDIPLIGGLFRGINNTDKQSHLYVFVKAEIIRPSEVLAGTSDLDRISELHRRAFEEHEAGFQMYESWPGVKGKPMGPKKVLESR